MAFVKVRIPRTSQPQDVCGIDWGNPLAKGLRRVLLGNAKHPQDLAESAPVTVGRNTYFNGVHIGPLGRALRAYNDPYNNGQEITFPAWENTSGEASFVLFQHRVVNILSNSWLSTGGGGGQHFPWNGNVQAAPFWSSRWIDTPPPIGKSFLVPHVLSASVKNGAQRAFWDGLLFASASQLGGFTLNSTIQLIQDDSTDMAYYCAYFFDRALSDAEVKSLSDNPWQIFEPEELTIWVPDAVGVGGPAAVYSDAYATYLIRAAAAQDLSASFAIRAATLASLDPAYNVRGSATADQAAAYNIRAAANLDLSPTYNVRGAAQIDLTHAYNLRGLIAKDAAAIYNVRGTVTADITPAYSIENAGTVASDLAAAYGVRGLVQSDASIAYELRGAVQTNLSPAYALRGAVAADLSGSYAVEAAVGVVQSDLTCSYVVDGVAAPCPSAADIAAAVLALAQITPIHADTRKMNGAAIAGSGIESDLWRGA